MTTRMASSPSPLIFVVMLASASIVSFMIIISPYILTFHDSSSISIAASVSPTQVGYNQTIKVTVTDRNALRFPNELPLTESLRGLNLSMGPCSDYPFGIAVLQGRHAADNISSAKTILIYAPGTYSCPGEAFANSFRFEPLQNLTASVKLAGYWTEGLTQHPGGGVSEGVLHPFLPGEYTVVAGDEWGHFQILHFVVLAGGGATVASASPTSTALSTNGTFAVTFQQIGPCSPTFWGVPWSVTIGSVTKVQPPDTKLPLDNYSLSGTSNSSLSEVAFSLANGTYEYRVSPSAGFFTPTSGTFNVTGSDITIQIAYTGTSCIQTIATTTTVVAGK